MGRFGRLRVIKVWAGGRGELMCPGGKVITIIVVFILFSSKILCQRRLLIVSCLSLER